MDPRRDHRRHRVREQRAHRHPCRQPTRTRAVLRALRRTRAAGQHRQVRIPRSTGRGDIRRLGPRRERVGRHPALRCRSGPPNRELSDLVAELATQSRAFRTRWATPNVRFHNAGVKHFCHPVVGDLRLTYNRLDLAADPGLTLFTYTAEPGLALRRNTEAPRQLGSHRRPHRSDSRDRPTLRRTAIRSRTARSRAPAPCAATATSGPAFNSGRSFSPYSSPPPNARIPRPPRALSHREAGAGPRRCARRAKEGASPARLAYPRRSQSRSGRRCRRCWFTPLAATTVAPLLSIKETRPAPGFGLEFAEEIQRSLRAWWYGPRR